MSLTGVWEGHYFQNWVTGEFVEMDELSEWASPIRTVICDLGGKIEGSMIDLITFSEIDGLECYSQLERNMSWLEKKEWREWLDQNPGAIMRIELPTDSTIDGDIDGRQISFTKVYDGSQVTTWITSEQESSVKVPTSPVFYLGDISENNTLITGTFKVVDPSGRAPTSKGRFRLRKKSEVLQLKPEG